MLPAAVCETITRSLPRHSSSRSACYCSSIAKEKRITRMKPIIQDRDWPRMRAVSWAMSMSGPAGAKGTPYEAARPRIHGCVASVTV